MKNDNKSTEDRLRALEIEQGIDKGISKWIRTVCITSTSMAASFFLWLGGEIYNKFYAIKVGIMAFLTAKGSNQ